ncbi:hypothetical protein [Halobacillus litoralis]|uniref:hypothetical protein n=1 Tax=Halobacillus litoralis TaxID=45668 RepID=UPI00248FE91F|nr:hypothetical protein [Halobacillus litoralis]
MRSHPGRHDKHKTRLVVEVLSPRKRLTYDSNVWVAELDNIQEMWKRPGRPDKHKTNGTVERLSPQRRLNYDLEGLAAAS